MKKIKPTVCAVLAFIVVLICALSAMNAKADGYIGLGKSVANSNVSFGEIGYRWGYWDAQIAVLGEGYTNKGNQGHVEIISVSRLVAPDWNFYSCDYFMRIGLAYVHDSPLVGPGNYRLGLGCDFGVWDLEYGHYSSAGISERNTGLDMIQMRVKF